MDSSNLRLFLLKTTICSMSSKPNFCLGPLEREILEIIWKKDCASVRCVLVMLNKSRQKNDKLAYTTVMTVMKRLLKKQVLLRKKEGRSFIYQAKQSRSKFIQQVVHFTVNDLVEKFGQLALNALKKEIDS